MSLLSNKIVSFSSRKEAANVLPTLPYEIWVHIFSIVDTETKVFSCRNVCKFWLDILENEILRKHKSINQPIPWFLYYECETNPIGKNLLLNTFGKDGFRIWEVTDNGGDMWAIELPFNGSKPLPEKALLENGIAVGKDVGCFATSFGYCVKHQMIKLEDFGVSPKLMDELRPTVEVSEWYAPRFDCASYYRMSVELLNSNHDVVQSKKFSVKMKQWSEGAWKKAVIVMKDYKKGVRFIRFEHQGNDLQFWAGHYGSKMTLSSVRLLMPCKLPRKLTVDH